MRLIAISLLSLGIGCSEATGPAPVASVEFLNSPSELCVGCNTQLYAVARGADGQVLRGRHISFTSSDTKVLSVTSTGRWVSGVAPGEATITATVESVSAALAVTVYEDGEW